MWPARAMLREEQMQQLTVTVEAGLPVDAGISSAESLLERLRRWMIGGWDRPGAITTDQ